MCRSNCLPYETRRNPTSVQVLSPPCTTVDLRLRLVLLFSDTPRDVALLREFLGIILEDYLSIL